MVLSIIYQHYLSFVQTILDFIGQISAVFDIM